MRLNIKNDMGQSMIDSMPSRRTGDSRWLALVILCTGFLMIVLDQTIVNVALPSIKNDLGFSQAGLAWVVNAYLIAYGGFLPLPGRLGGLDRRQRAFLLRVFLFTAPPPVFGLSLGPPMLRAPRSSPGIGG